jgi:hypothetical protein
LTQTVSLGFKFYGRFPVFLLLGRSDQCDDTVNALGCYFLLDLCQTSSYICCFRSTLFGIFVKFGLALSHDSESQSLVKDFAAFSLEFCLLAVNNPETL